MNGETILESEELRKHEKDRDSIKGVKARGDNGVSELLQISRDGARGRRAEQSMKRGKEITICKEK